MTPSIDCALSSSASLHHLWNVLWVDPENIDNREPLHCAADKYNIPLA